MPTYEYECTTCGQHIEVFQRFSEDSLTVCGVCGGVLRKVFHPAGIVFKGSGFYVTDSRSTAKDRSEDKATEKGEKQPTASKTEAGSSTSTSSSPSSSSTSDGGSKASETGGSKAASKDTS